jgi:hypothetical protein
LLEELCFLHQLCSTVLFANKSVKYVGVLDSRGKLLLGEYRKEVQNTMLHPLNEIRWKDNFFYLSCFLNAIMGNDFDSSSIGSKLPPFKHLQFHTSSLAISPLTETEDKYLCLYLQSESICDEIVQALDVIWRSRHYDDRRWCRCTLVSDQLHVASNRYRWPCLITNNYDKIWTL